ncbi:MAG: PAS domain S-box protein [Myxococcales bacterium]|nr:PAS domain S-box protein [Myxococcales bacterium]
MAQPQLQSQDFDPRDELLDKIQLLEDELAAIKTAFRERENVITQGFAKMDVMLVEVEAQRNEQKAVAEALDQAKGFTERVLDTMSEALLVLDPQGYIKRVNRRTLELTGYSEAELMGVSADRLFVDEEIEALRESKGKKVRPEFSRAYQVFAQIRGCELRGGLVRKDGSRIPHLFSWGDIRSPQGKREGLVVIGTDVRDIETALGSLAKAHAGMRLVLDNVDQGFVTADLEGRMSCEYSATMDKWFGKPDLHQPVWAWFGGSTEDQPEGVNSTFCQWLSLGFGELREGLLPDELTLSQLPQTLKRGKRTFSVEYRLIDDGAPAPRRVLIVVSDITAELERERAEAEDRQFVAVCRRIMKDRDGFESFFQETDALVRGLDRGDYEQDMVVKNRIIHTLKGNAAIWGFESVAALCHTLEDEISQGQEEEAREALAKVVRTWRETMTRLEDVLVERDEGITLAQTEYTMVLEALRSKTSHDKIERFVRSWSRERSETRLKRAAHQAEWLGIRLGRPVNVTIEANQLRLPDLAWDGFWSALIHAVRNALDHGIEPAEERQARGKRPVGQMRLVTEHKEGHVVVALEDDGRGIDWEKVRTKAASVGAPSTTNEDLEDALFLDGLSTRDEVTSLSGRGVGMSALRQACRDLGGNVKVSSVPGQGTRLEFWMPYPGIAAAANDS